MRKTLLLMLLSLTIVASLVFAWYARGPQAAISANFVGPNTINSSSIAGYARAYKPRTFNFPADHGPHPDYQLEWWYYTGNLQSADGRRWGFQLTFFRRSLTPLPINRASDWGTNQAYLAHFAVTDVAGGRFYAASAAARGGRIGLAGATGDPYRVFVKTWSAEGTGNTARLRAQQDNVAIDLNVQTRKQPTLQGEAGNGLSQKGKEPGNASYYYSLTRMETTGSITVDGKTLPVTGFSWMDHEFGTSALGQGQTGWDWFGLQFDDGRELMWGQLRRADGSIDVGQGSLTNADGTVISLKRTDVQVQNLATWQSPHSGANYPSRWRIRIPRLQLDLLVEPLINDQELNVGLTYWEGAARVSGTTSGYGYVELTGYGLNSPPVR